MEAIKREMTYSTNIIHWTFQNFFLGHSWRDQVEGQADGRPGACLSGHPDQEAAAEPGNIQAALLRGLGEAEEAQEDDPCGQLWEVSSAGITTTSDSSVEIWGMTSPTR